MKPFLESLEEKAIKRYTPCGEGKMVWRIWECTRPNRPNLVMLHGGSGSWTHWIRNIEPLREHFRLILPDTPGLGDSADLPMPYTPASIAQVITSGLLEIPEFTGGGHLLGFSWGGLLSGYVALHSPQIKTLTLVGPSGMGVRWGHMSPLLRRDRGMGPSEMWHTNKENVSRLLLHNRNNIDDLSVRINIYNTDRSRMKSKLFSREDFLYQSLRQVAVPVHALWGEHDITAVPYLQYHHAKLKLAQPHAEFYTISEAGHWAQYENAAVFNKIVPEILSNYQ